MQAQSSSSKYSENRKIGTIFSVFRTNWSNLTVAIFAGLEVLKLNDLVF